MKLGRGCIAGLAATIAVLAFPLGGVAGECTEGVAHYLSDLERRGPDMWEAMSCLRCTPEDYWRWAGPIAAARFEQCRVAPFRERLEAACAPLLSDSVFQEYRDYDTRYGIAALLGTYGIARAGEGDVFKILTVEKSASVGLSMTDHMALAVLRDPRTLHFLSTEYDSLPPENSRQRTDRLVAILNCLYHIPGDSALVLAKRIGQQEKAEEIGERVNRVLVR